MGPCNCGGDDRRVSEGSSYDPNCSECNRYRSLSRSSYTSSTPKNDGNESSYATVYTSTQQQHQQPAPYVAQPYDDADEYTSSSTSSMTSSLSSRRPNQQQVPSPAAQQQRGGSVYDDETTGSCYSTSDIIAQSAAAGAVSGPPNASMAYEPKRGFTPYIKLGPVIGMVTETTARVLIECSADCEVRCFLTDAYGVQHGSVLRCPKNLPVAFQFDELRCGTFYRVSFDIPVPGLVKSGFNTLPANWSLSEFPARVAVVSDSDVLNTHVTEKTDAYKALYSQCKRGKIDYCLHLGNNVYVDSRDYKMSPQRGAEYTNVENPSAFQEALSTCGQASGSFSESLENHICETFRQVYRESWTRPCVRHALANVPNLMIASDTELGVPNADIYRDADPQSFRFVQKCAYRVYNEYCRALFENNTKDTPGGVVTIGQAYHFHAFGELGVVFLDTKADSLFHKGRKDDQHAPFLGVKQWTDLEYAFADDGYLCNCKALLVCTSSPVCQCPGSDDSCCCCHSGSAMMMAGTWNSPVGETEGAILLSKLFDWKNSSPGKRSVVLCAGSCCEGGLTTIKDDRYKRHGGETIEQVTTGPIASVRHKDGPALSKASMCSKHVGKDYTFKHNKVIKARNFAIVSLERNPESGILGCTTEHIVAKKKAMVSMKHQG